MQCASYLSYLAQYDSILQKILKLALFQEVSPNFFLLWERFSFCVRTLAEDGAMLLPLLEASQFLRSFANIFGLRDSLGLTNKTIEHANAVFVLILGFLHTLDPLQRDKYYYGLQKKKLREEKRTNTLLTGKIYNDAVKQSKFIKFLEQLPQFLLTLSSNPQEHKKLSNFLRYFFAGVLYYNSLFTPTAAQ